MISAKLVGAGIVAIPLIMVAWALLWRRARPVFWFALAMILVGTGYLMATGATDEIAQWLVPSISNPPPIRAK